MQSALLICGFPTVDAKSGDMESQLYLFVLELNENSIKKVSWIIRGKNGWSSRDTGGDGYQAHVRTSLLMRSRLHECPSPSFIHSLDNLPKRQTLLLFRVSPNMRLNLSQFPCSQNKQINQTSSLVRQWVYLLIIGKCLKQMTVRMLFASTVTWGSVLVEDENHLRMTPK